MLFPPYVGREIAPGQSVRSMEWLGVADSTLGSVFGSTSRKRH